MNVGGTGGSPEEAPNSRSRNNFDDLVQSPALETIFRAMETAFQQRAETSGGTNETRLSKACRQFREMNPPIFQGDSDPIKAEAWLLAVEQIFTLLQITDDDLRLLIAPCYFRDTATIWWTTQKELLGQTDLTWAAFRALFLDTYFPEALQDRKYFEFLNLVQGNMSVHEYQLKFNTLARYAPEYAATEKRRYQKFESGLHARIQVPVLSNLHGTFTNCVNSAIKVESAFLRAPNYAPTASQTPTDQTEYYSAQTVKDKAESSITESSKIRKKKRSRDPSPPLHILPLSAKVPKGSCYNCGQYGHSSRTCSHPISCRICGTEGHIQPSCPSVLCYYCNQRGHIQLQCPKKKL